MIDYIKGNITELNPTEVILECYGIGYRILISLQTYEGLNGKSDAKVYIHHYMREDEELYYGFATKDERELFRLLIGVSGIGASTSRMMLSSLTTDPITKRRIENFGEVEQYYVKDHHEPIVSEEVWEKAQEIRISRNRPGKMMADGKREKYTKKYALSSMCECGFCGTKLTRRTLHSSSKYVTPVWYCRTAANKGKENCPHSKSIHESILENAFLEAYGLLAENFDDVLESVLSTVEEVIGSSDDVNRLRKEKKALDNLEQRRKKLTDMLLDDTISKEAYDEKYEEMTTKIAKSKQMIEILQENAENQKNVGKRMESLRKHFRTAIS